jgi:NAD-dependent SIR2 family protein deacetylase
VVGLQGWSIRLPPFPQTVKDNEGFVVEVNVEPAPISSIADASLYGNSGDILTMLVKWLKEKRG